jgi:tetratricopeptide (TPR) repeat protein
VADIVARHLVTTARLIDEEPEQALAHALAARRLASRIGVVREAAGLAAYHAGEWQTAIAELRTYHRMSGRQAHLAVIADCERALGRPERAVDLYRNADLESLDRGDAVELLIVAAGARADLGQRDAAVTMLQVRELTAVEGEPWVARLRYAYADALLDAGRREEAREWFSRAAQADEESATDAAERLLELDGVVLDEAEEDTDVEDVDAQDVDADVEDDEAEDVDADAEDVDAEDADVEDVDAEDVDVEDDEADDNADADQGDLNESDADDLDGTVAEARTRRNADAGTPNGDQLRDDDHRDGDDGDGDGDHRDEVADLDEEADGEPAADEEELKPEDAAWSGPPARSEPESAAAESAGTAATGSESAGTAATGSESAGTAPTGSESAGDRVTGGPAGDGTTLRG